MSRWKNLLQKPWCAVFILTAVCFLIYSHILNAPFQFDDFGLLMGNPHIESLPHFQQNWQRLARKALTFFTFALNYQIGKHEPFGYHLVNVILHIFNACFLYYIVLHLLRLPSLAQTVFARERHLFALFSSLIFLIHPLQTQSVTYIWQRSEVLSGFFYLSGYWAYVRGRITKQSGYFLLTGLLFYTGLFAKGTVVTLPLLILLTEFYFLAGPRTKKILGMFTVGITGLFILSLFFTDPFRMLLEKLQLGFLARTWQEMQAVDYLWTQFKVLMVYIKLAFVPVGQNVDYYFPNVRTFFNWPTVLSLMALMMIGGAAVYLYRRQRLMSFGIVWFFIYLIPTSTIFLLVDLIFEHRVYVSMAGFGIFLTALLWMIPREKIRHACMIGIVVILCGLTIARNNLWRSPVALMEDSAQKSPMNPRPYLNLGTYFYRLGNRERAAHYYEKALALKPFYPELYNNLGLIYRDQGELDKAEAMFEKALSINPNFALAYINLAYVAMDRALLAEAEQYLAKVAKIETSDKVYTAWGYLHAYRRDHEQARANFIKALEFNPNNMKAAFGLGNVYFTQKQYPQALVMYQKALEIEPLFQEAKMNMMQVYFEMGDFEKYKELQTQFNKAGN